jgi:hypothetical protein
MADLKISALTASTTPLAGTEVLPIVQSSTTKQVSVANLTAGRAISATSVTASTGNFVVGTSGQGVDFSATPGTGTSELLADYEEGTWTPNANSGWTDVGTVTRTGTYTKIGRQVFITVKIAASGGGSVSMSTATISNLPYTAANPTVGGWGVISNYGGATQTQNVLVDGVVMYFTGSWVGVANYQYTASVTYAI